MVTIVHVGDTRDEVPRVPKSLFAPTQFDQEVSKDYGSGTRNHVYTMPFAFHICHNAKAQQVIYLSPTIGHVDTRADVAQAASMLFVLCTEFDQASREHVIVFI